MNPGARFLGRFQILSRIAQGGMGALYRAHDPVLDREVAIKVLREDFDNPELRERFSREAQSAARLHHPNIVTIFDVGEHDGKPFIAMEYIQGVTLAEIVRQASATSLERKLQLMEALASALAYAHARGIVHRDIKPANLMVDADGTLKVLDFGIARVAESGLTRAGMMMGTLNYMSPEQLSGGAVDARSDIFAVGAVYYELLSGRQAFAGGIDSGVLNRILNGVVDDLGALCPNLDRSIINVVNRCLQLEPEQRYQDLGATRRDIATILRRLNFGTPTPGVDDGETIVVNSPPADAARTPVRAGSSRTDLERRRQEQIDSHLQEARRHIAAEAFEAALAACDRALLLDPDNAAAAALYEQAQSALAARQAAQWLREADGQLAIGATTAAEELLNRAMEIAPGTPGADNLRARIAEVRRERERERERQERVKSMIARSAAALERGDFETARQEAEAALSSASDSVEARRLLNAAREALNAQEVRRFRDSIDSAQRLFDAERYDEALAVLDRVTVTDASMIRTRDELRRQIAAVRTAREPRVKSAPTSPPEPVERPAVDRNAFNAAPTVIVDRVDSPQLPSTRPTPARPVEQISSIEPPRERPARPRWMIPAATGVAAIALVAWLVRDSIPLQRRQTTTSTSIETATTTMPPTQTTAPSTSTSIPPPVTSVTTTAPVTTSAAPADTRLAALRVASRQQLARRNLTAALARVNEGLRLDRNDEELKQILKDIVREARNEASTARRSAAGARTTAAFAAADRSFNEADTLARGNNDDGAARQFLTAADQFMRAARQTPQIASVTSSSVPVSIPPVTSAVSTSVPPATTSRLTTSVSSPPATTSIAPATSAPPPTSTSSSPQPDPRAAALAAIDRALDECQAAWASMSAERVAVCGPVLANSSRQRVRGGLLASQSLRIDNRRVSQLTDDAAAVACRLTFQDVSKRDGRMPPTTSEGTFTLRRRGQSWTIEGFAR